MLKDIYINLFLCIHVPNLVGFVGALLESRNRIPRRELQAQGVLKTVLAVL